VEAGGMINDPLHLLLRQHLDALEGDVSFAIEAEKFIANADRKVIDAWLDDHLITLMSAELRRVAAAGRRQLRASSSPCSVFRDAAAEATTGGSREPLKRFTVFEVMFPFNEESEQRRLGEMGKAHCLGAADYYRNEAMPFLMEEAFFRALAKKVGSKTVSEVFTEEQVIALRRNLEGFDKAA
jgi:hypothetical protein